jgi:transcriptional regulator with XRE-family HTH domain
MGKSLGTRLGEARTAHGLSLQEVADAAGCSAPYVHKLEGDHVRSPSPRVLAGLADALGLRNAELMTAAGYEAPVPTEPAGRATAVKRFSNAHIVELLEDLQRDVRALRAEVAAATAS